MQVECKTQNKIQKNAEKEISERFFWNWKRLMIKIFRF